MTIMAIIVRSNDSHVLEGIEDAIIETEAQRLEALRPEWLDPMYFRNLEEWEHALMEWGGMLP